jgi:hypothetical protein
MSNTKAKPYKLELQKTTQGCAMFESQPRYDIILNGEKVGQLYYNLRGYVGTLPTPDGMQLTIGEQPITTYKREVAALNREEPQLRREWSDNPQTWEPIQTKRGGWTPWGPAQSVEQIADGIELVDTAGHGGLRLSAERWELIMEAFPTQTRYAADGWLEEDCDFTLAVLLWPESFPASYAQAAITMLREKDPADAAKWGDYFAPAREWFKTGNNAAPVQARAGKDWKPMRQAA